MPTRSNRGFCSLLLLGTSLLAGACGESPVETDTATAPAPEVAQPPDALPDGYVTLAEFTVEVNPELGTLEFVEFAAPRTALGETDLRTVEQADWCETRVTSGRPRTVGLVTDPASIGFTMADCGVSGFPYDGLGVFCFDATVSNYFGEPLRVLAQITSVRPDSGYNPYVYLPGVQEVFGASAADTGPSQVEDAYNELGLGLFDHGVIPAGGSTTVKWGFEYQPGVFRFVGRMLAFIPETCNGVDDDCDGRIDEGRNNVNNCSACGFRSDLGVYGGEVMYGPDAVDGTGASLRGEVDWTATVEAAQASNVDTFVVEVGFAGGVPLIEDVIGLTDALSATGSSGTIIPMFDGPKRRGQTLAAWETDFNAVVAALSAHDSPYVESFVIQQIHRDLCTPTTASTVSCWSRSDVARLTATLNGAMGGRGLRHLLYTPADYRALTYFDDALWMSTNFNNRRVGERLVVATNLTLNLSAQQRVTAATLSYAWAPQPDANHKFVADIVVDGVTTTLRDSGPLTSGSGLSVGGVGRVNYDDTLNLRPLFATKTAATDVRVAFSMETLANGFSSTTVVIGDVELRFEITDTSTVPATVQTVTRTLSQFTDISETYTTAATVPNVLSTAPFNLTTVADGTMVQVLSSDALTDRLFADDPRAGSETLRWAEASLPSTYQNYALLSAVDSYTISGWYHWEDGLFRAVAELLNDALLQGIILLDAPLALAAPDEGIFAQDTTGIVDGYFSAAELPNATPLQGWFHAYETTATPEPITRLFVWDSSSAGDRLRSRVLVDTGSGEVVVFDQQTSADEGDWSGGTCGPPYVAPQLEVAGLPAVDQVCMIEVDLSPVGGQIPAGSFVRFESTLVQEPEGPGAGILNVEVATSGDRVVFLPACGTSACNLDDGSWSFASGIAIPDVPAVVAQYPWDIYESMLADFTYVAPAASCSTF